MIGMAIRRPVATAAIYLALLLLGLYAFRLIPLELLPDVSYPRLRVRAEWPGASPEALSRESTCSAPARRPRWTSNSAERPVWSSPAWS
jgi:multidrug efflux pump subunit AcrB